MNVDYSKMVGPQAYILQDSNRLHLQHGPIDLIVGVDRFHRDAFELARARFATILDELTAELSQLRAEMTGPFISHGFSPIGERMVAACQTHAAQHFVTPMAAVAGAVADEVLAAMVSHMSLSKAYVNNGGDVAIHLANGARFKTLISAYDGTQLGHINIKCHQQSQMKIGGIATSGLHGRSFSLGIADSVTVLARTASEADVAATLIANAIDLPDSDKIQRTRANMLDPDSDLGDRKVVIHCEPLERAEVAKALNNGLHVATSMHNEGKIVSAALFLQGDSRVVGHEFMQLREKHAFQEREYAYA